MGDDHGDDNVNPPGDVLPEEDDVDERSDAGRQEYGAPQDRVFHDLPGCGADGFVEREIENRDARKIDRQEDGRIDVIDLPGLGHDRLDLSNDNINHFLLSYTIITAA